MAAMLAGSPVRKWTALAAVGLIGPASFAEEGSFFADGVSGLVGGIDAEDEDLIVLAGSEGGLGEAGGEAVLHLRAEHGALVIDLGHDGGLAICSEPGSEGRCGRFRP